MLAVGSQPGPGSIIGRDPWSLVSTIRIGFGERTKDERARIEKTEATINGPGQVSNTVVTKDSAVAGWVWPRAELIGYRRSSGPLTTLGACLSVMGFGAQAVLWYGLRGEEK